MPKILKNQKRLFWNRKSKVKNIPSQEKYYQKIKKLNIKHYSGEVPYYSTADLRPAEKTLLSKIDRKAKLLDLGCGSGRFSIGAARLGFQVTGVDITPDAVKAATKRAKELKLKNANFRVGDMTELNFATNSFGVVFCPRFVINAVSTVPRRKMAVKEMLRVVKKGGTVYIESFNRFYLGMGLYVLVRNLLTDLTRNLKLQLSQITDKEYTGLLPGDMIYPSNKVRGATEGYAHIPTIFELKEMVPKDITFKVLSIPEIVYNKKFDPLKYFRYSLWLILKKD